MKKTIVFFVLILISAYPSSAETIEVARGATVTKTTYPVPINEQPFFGFATKTPGQTSADEEFVANAIKLVGSRQKASDETLKRGWSALFTGDAVTASRRFNQAYLLTPEPSRIYHAFAALVQTRFNDMVYADELFQIALKQPNPYDTLRADYGRFLLIAKRPVDARPILEQATVDTPKLESAWSNLAFARLQTGDQKGACTAAETAEKLAGSDNVKSDIALLKRKAQC